MNERLSSYCSILKTAKLTTETKSPLSLHRALNRIQMPQNELDLYIYFGNLETPAKLESNCLSIPVTVNGYQTAEKWPLVVHSHRCHKISKSEPRSDGWVMYPSIKSEGRTLVFGGCCCFPMKPSQPYPECLDEDKSSHPQRPRHSGITVWSLLLPVNYSNKRFGALLRVTYC